MSPNGKLVRKWRYDMHEVSCYGCKYDSEKWADECKKCIRMFLKCKIKDRYQYEKKDHMFQDLALHAMVQEFDVEKLCLIAEWEVPENLMWGNPKCSNCGFESADHKNYCPNCGAKIIGYCY